MVGVGINFIRQDHRFKKRSIFMMNFIIFAFLNFSVLFSESDISFLKKKCQISEKIDFWHLNFFKQTQSPILTGKNTNVVMLDSQMGMNYSACNDHLAFRSNFSQDRSFDRFGTNAQKSKKRSSEAMEKKDVSKEFFQKSHGGCTLSIIQQLAPEATVISIPVLDDRGYAKKEEVYQALKLAKTFNPDILHLGFQILDFDLKQTLDKKIHKLLKKFTFVIVPVGNNVKSDFPPKLPNVFTVASFNKKNDIYPISKFCQNIYYADFVMPGEKIWVNMWNPKTQDYDTLSVSGTSFSAALMTGFLALLFEKNNKKPGQIKADLLKLSTFLEEDWQDVIRYGFPHF